MSCAEYRKAIGARIRELRAVADRTLPELSKLAGVSKGNLSKVEHGSNASIETLCRLADALGVPVKELLP